MWRPIFSDCRSFSTERVQVVLGLPFGRFHSFGKRPIAAFTARWWSSFGFVRAMWPKKRSLLSNTSSYAGICPVLTSTSMLVMCLVSVRSMRRKHHCSKASNFLRIMSVVVQVSQLYRRTGSVYVVQSYLCDCLDGGSQDITVQRCEA